MGPLGLLDIPSHTGTRKNGGSLALRHIICNISFHAHSFWRSLAICGIALLVEY